MSMEETNNIITTSQDADAAFSRLYEYATDKDGHPRLAYTLMPSLLDKFPQSQVISAVMNFCTFDAESDHEHTRKAAIRAKRKIDRLTGVNRFHESIAKNSLGHLGQKIYFTLYIPVLKMTATYGNVQPLARVMKSL